MPDFRLSGRIEKVDECQGLVFGWSYVSITKDGAVVSDHSGDVVSIEDIEGCAYDYVLYSRDGGEMHVSKGVSRLVESMVFTPEKIEALGLPEGSVPCGWWVGYKIDDADVLAKAKSGEYPAFSIEGSGVREPLLEPAP